jgi:opacity protein-like surface antigen
MNKFKVISAISGLFFSLLICLNTSAQVVEQGSIIIDGYYGFPNFTKIFFKGEYASSGTELDLTVEGLGPLGIRGEYILYEKFGLGFDIAYNNTKLNYNEISEVFNSTTGNYEDVSYSYDFRTKKIGVIVCFNYHFLDNEKFDVFGTVGMGYARRFFDFSSSDPNFADPEIYKLSPFGSKIGLGMRYFFTRNIGANLQFGLGQGGLINIGISAKF